jgi:hypothetical protein
LERAAFDKRFVGYLNEGDLLEVEMGLSKSGPCAAFHSLNLVLGSAALQILMPFLKRSVLIIIDNLAKRENHADRTKLFDAFRNRLTIIDDNLMATRIHGVRLEVPGYSEKAIELSSPILWSWYFQDPVKTRLAAELEIETNPFHLLPLAIPRSLHLENAVLPVPVLLNGIGKKIPD